MTERGGQQALAIAEELAAVCVRELGDAVVAVILHGSLVLGDFRPGRSDVDVLVVVERPLRDGEIEALRERVDGLRTQQPGGIDVRVVTRAVAAAPTPAPALELYLGLHGDGTAEVETRVAGERDLVAEFSIVRATGRSLVGPDARLVVGAIPGEWVVAYGDEQLARWQRLTGDAKHAELMVLTTCRIWQFAAEAVHSSKSEAGRWAVAREPSLTAVEAALRQRRGEPGVVVEADGIARLLARVRGEISPPTRRR
jgi:hypothetical protein